jgi:hypothetical protein
MTARNERTERTERTLSDGASANVRHGTTEVWGCIGDAHLMATWHSPDDFYSFMRKENQVTTNGATIAAQKEQAIARPLHVLVPLIKEELAAGAAAGVEHYRRAGEMLLEAKAGVSRGEWMAWVERHFHLSRTTATNYMNLAAATRNTRGLVIPSLQQFVAPNRAARVEQRPWHAPVNEILTRRIDVDKLAEERQSREKEQRLIRDLAYQLIDIGYKVLATKLHPDKGGPSHAMARLNRVRTLLRNAV